MQPPASHEHQVVAALQQARKYAHLCPQTLQRTAMWACLRYAKHDEAIKAAKRKLHQVFASYLSNDWRKVEKLLHQVDWQNDDEVERSARQVLQWHTSSAERIDDLTDLYRQWWAITGVPESLVDLGGGLHGFALPWMGLPRSTRYNLTEIDTRLVALVNQWLQGWGQAGQAHALDLLVTPWTQQVDVALLLKVAPCLEQQEPGATLRLLRDIPARWIIVSFPTRSLGGRDKGMSAHYDEQMQQWANALQRPLQVVAMTRETYYLLRGSG